MGKFFQIFAYAVTIIIGGLLIIFKDGHIEIVCIACNGFLTNLFGTVAILTGIIGLAGTIASKRAITSGR